MSNRLVRYYFGRLNLIATYTNKKDFLLRGLRTDKLISNRNFSWGFFDIKEIESEDGLFLHGYLVKYRPESEQEIALPDKHRLGEITIPNIVEAKARFFLHVHSGLIAFHPVAIQIEIEIFRERFVEIFHEALDKLFVNAEIQLIKERFELLEVMKKFNYISKVEVKLHPSNPNLSYVWKDFDKRLKELGATDYKEIYETKKENSTLKIVDDEVIKSKITMAEDGYGEAGVTGGLEGEEKTITTSENPLYAHSADDEEPPEKVLGGLSETIKKISERFEK